MQEQHFNELKEDVGEAVAKRFPPDARDRIRAKVAQAIEKLAEDNKLLSLPEDEYELLLAYRLWKQSPDVAGGIFHWKTKGE